MKIVYNCEYGFLIYVLNLSLLEVEMEQSLKTKLNKVMLILMYETSLELKIKELQYKLEQAEAEVAGYEAKITDFKKNKYNYDSLCSFSNILLLISIYGFIAAVFLSLGAFFGVKEMAVCTLALGIVSVVMLVISYAMKLYSKRAKVSMENELAQLHAMAARERARVRSKCEPGIAGIKRQIEKGRRASREYFVFLPEQYRNADAVTFMLKVVEEKKIDSLEEVIKLYEEEIRVKESYGLGISKEESIENMQNLAAKMDEKYAMSEETILWLFDMYS